MRRYLGLTLVVLFAFVYVGYAELVITPPVGGGVPVGGSCATANGVAIFTASTTLACSGLVASSGIVTTGTWNVTGGSVTAGTGVFTTSITAPLRTAAAGITVATTATAPAVAATSTAGTPATLTASAATAGNITNGAAAGGPVTITSGNAARLNSGNAAGGDIIFTVGSGIGTGGAGTVIPGASGTQFGTQALPWNVSINTLKYFSGGSAPNIDIGSSVANAIGFSNGSAAADVIIRRSTTKTITFDTDGASGALTLFNVVGPQTVSGHVIFSGLSAASGSPHTVCIDATTHEVTENAAATCTVSSARFKNTIHDQGSAWPILAALVPREFRMNGSPAPRVGFIAEEVEAADPRLVAYDRQGRPHSVRYEDIVSVLTKGVQELERRVQALEAR